MARPVDQAWYETAFSALYPVVYAHRTREAARPEAAFAAQRLELSANDLVLDLCCGNGRHMAHLREKTRRVVGLDFSADLLRIARQGCAAGTCVVQADMRAAPFVNVFDVVTNFFTSFGYFVTDEENAAVVNVIARALKPGGRFFIDYVNPAYLRNNLVPHSTRYHHEFTIVEDRWLDQAMPRVNKRTTLLCRSNIVATFEESVRLYTHAEMAAMIAGAGLALHATFGDYAGADFGEAYPRMILLGAKEGHHG
jgi:SAM-dependent methyltransferase